MFIKNQMKEMIFYISKQKKTTKWSKEEDEIILKYSKFPQRNKWRLLSGKLKNKSPSQCYIRSKINNPILKKGKFTLQEDRQLLNLVAQFGTAWNFISKIIKNRNSKQLRLRYTNHLDIRINKNKFTKEDDCLILKLFEIYKNSWGRYVSFLNNRSTDKIKRRYLKIIKNVDKKKSIKKIFKIKRKIKSSLEIFNENPIDQNIIVDIFQNLNSTEISPTSCYNSFNSVRNEFFEISENGNSEYFNYTEN